MKKFLLPVLFLTAALLALAACSPKTTQPAAAATTVESTNLIAEGHLFPVNSQDLSFSNAGQVAEVLVKDGDQVSAGQPLVRLIGKEEVQARITTAEYTLADAQMALDTLKKNSTTQFATAQKTLADAQKALKDAQDERYRKNLARVAQTTIDQRQSDLIIAQDVLKKAKENYANFENKPENDLQRAQSFSALAAAQQKVDQIQYDLNWLLSGPDKNEIAQADAAIVVAQSKLDDAQREFDLLKAGPDPVEMKVATTRIANAEAQLAAAQKALAGLELRAPFSGVVTFPNLQAGDYLTFGQTACTVADFTNWVVKTDNLTETDVVNLRVGQKVSLVLDALPGQSISGEVTHINLFSEEKRGDITYTVTAVLSQSVPQMRSGMTAAVQFIP
jgi:multidrug resistance efflux pump